MTPQELRDRLAAFAQEVALFVRPLNSSRGAQDVARQLARAAASAAAKHRAAGRARSHTEFTSKLAVSLEEADEAQFWIQQLRETGEVGRDASEPLWKEAGELVAILTRSVHTARQREAAAQKKRGNRRNR